MAIAFDAVSSAGNSGGTITTTHTMGAGVGGVIYAYVWANTTSNVVSGVTAGGVSMTRIGTIQTGTYVNSGGNYSTYLYALASPSTGSISVVATITGGASAGMNVISYTGASQTGIPDSINYGGPFRASPITASTTVVAANSWTVMFVGVSNNTGSAGTGSTLRNSAGVVGGSFGNYDFDSNGTVSTGSHNMEYNVTSSTDSIWTMISVAPYVAPATNGNFIAFM